MSSKKISANKAATKKIAPKKANGADYPPNQKDVDFEFKAKPGTYAAILEAAAYAKKVGLRNYARS